MKENKRLVMMKLADILKCTTRYRDVDNVVYLSDPDCVVIFYNDQRFDRINVTGDAASIILQVMQGLEMIYGDGNSSQHTRGDVQSDV
jgi:hypothetical protein